MGPRTTSTAILLSALLAACSRGGSAPADLRVEADAPLDDARIAAVLDVANHAEVRQAELATERAARAEVRGYAAAMIAGHGAAVEQQAALVERRGIDPEFSALAGRLMDRNMETQEALRGLRGAAFDRAYMQAQLMQHRALLRLLDEELIPSAEDPELRAYLRRLRADVAQHLVSAERIRANLAG